MTTPRKVSELAALTVPATEDLLLIVDDPSVDPVSKKITFGNLTRTITSNTITVNNEVVLTQLSVGNGATNSAITYTTIKVGNTTVNTSITPTSISVGNSTVNTVITANSIVVGNATYISLSTFKSVVANSSTFADFKTNVAAL